MKPGLLLRYAARSTLLYGRAHKKRGEFAFDGRAVFCRTVDVSRKSHAVTHRDHYIR